MNAEGDLPAGHQALWGVLFAGLIGFAIYRRFRRNFGRQALRPRRMAWRIAVLTAVGAAVLPMAARSAAFLAAAASGAALGVGLGVWGARHTRFERSGGALYYIPHTYTGMAVFALFLGRIVYRLPRIAAGGSAAGGADAGATAQSPLTLALLLAVVGYYGYYYAALLLKSRHIGGDDMESSEAGR